MSDFELTSDFVSCIVLFGRAMKAAIGEATDLGLTEYRLLSYLEQQPQGATPSELARIAGLTPGTISSALSRLYERDFAAPFPNPANAASLVVRITDAGIRLLPCCDEALEDAHERFFEPLSDDLKANLLSGSLVTSSFLGVTRMENSHYFAQYSVLVGSLMNELYFMKLTREHGISLGEFRVLLALKEHPSAGSPTQIRRLLCAHRSELSNWCHGLQRKGLATASPHPGDKRRVHLAATARGLQLIARIASRIDVGTVRPAHEGEANLYSGIFHIVMEHLRTIQEP